MIRNAVNRRHISNCSYRFSFRQSQKVSRLAIGDLKKKVPKPSGILTGCLLTAMQHTTNYFTANSYIKPGSFTFADISSGV